MTQFSKRTHFAEIYGNIICGRWDKNLSFTLKNYFKNFHDVWLGFYDHNAQSEMRTIKNNFSLEYFYVLWMIYSFHVYKFSRWCDDNKPRLILNMNFSWYIFNFTTIVDYNKTSNREREKIFLPMWIVKCFYVKHTTLLITVLPK
jgi:hypothetical protein